MSADPQVVFSEAERTDLSDWIQDWLKEGHGEFEIAEAFGRLLAQHTEGSGQAPTRQHMKVAAEEGMKRAAKVARALGVSVSEIATLVAQGMEEGEGP